MCIFPFPILEIQGRERRDLTDEDGYYGEPPMQIQAGPSMSGDRRGFRHPHWELW